MNQNRVIGLVMLAFVVWWTYLTYNLPPSTVPNEPGPKFFPYVILAVMAIASVIMMLAKPKKDTSAEGEIKADDSDGEPEPQQEQEFAMKDVLILFALFFVGIILVSYLGFNVGMIIGLSAMLWFIGWKLFPRAILFSASVTLALYVLFSWLLKIPLPKGILF